MKITYTINRQLRNCAGNSNVNVTVPVQSCYYPIDDMYKFINIDGHFFNLTPRDKCTKKRLTNKFLILPGCDPYKPYELWLCYDTCVTFCSDCGVYLSPWLTFRSYFGHDCGFTCGSGVDDDHPATFKTLCQTWSTDIGRVLITRCNQVIPDLNGYCAIHELTKSTHPTFQAQASDIILDLPKQLPRETLSVFFLQ